MGKIIGKEESKFQILSDIQDEVFKYADSHTFIQWKGTDVCCDVHCPNCGFHGHVDAEFFYHYKCPSCKKVYIVGNRVILVEVGYEPENCVITGEGELNVD